MTRSNPGSKPSTPGTNGSKARTGSSSGQTLSGNNSCAACSKSVTRSKCHLKCSTCHEFYHTLCIPEWNDITNQSELAIFDRPGVMWYCAKCQPTLKDYVLASGLKDSVELLSTKVDNVTKLLCENVKISKTYASVVNDNADIKNIAVRLEEKIQKQTISKERNERDLSAIVHGLSETGNTHDYVLDTLDCVSFGPSTVKKITRLGQRVNETSTDSSKIRPVRITFNSEVNKIDFIRRYNNWSDRNNTFATPDLSKEEQERGYKLRVTRRELIAKNPENKYRIRNGSIFVQNTNADPTTWEIVPESE